MKGFCLMSLQRLTGREVLRTQIFWRIMMKRVLWGFFEEMRRNSDRVEDYLDTQADVPITNIGLLVWRNSARSARDVLL